MARITYREAVSQALREELYRDERVFILGEEIGTWGDSFFIVFVRPSDGTSFALRLQNALRSPLCRRAGMISSW